MKSKYRLPQASSAIVWLASAASCALLSGCGPMLNGEEAVPSEQAMELPESSFSGNLFLIGGQTRVHVGDPTSLAQEAFPKPKRSFAITSVPAGFDEKYQVYGWENPTRSFGVLTQKGRIALALDIREHATDALIAEEVKKAMTAYGQPSATYSSGKVQYWFWDDSQVRLMLCAAPDDKGRIALSQALGYAPLMDEFRMSPSAAAEDRVTAERLLSQPKPKS